MKSAQIEKIIRDTFKTECVWPETKPCLVEGSRTIGFTCAECPVLFSVIAERIETALVLEKTGLLPGFPRKSS